MEKGIEVRLIGEGMVAFKRLNLYQQSFVIKFLEENPRETIWSAQELVEAYLVWEGIINYTSNIVSFVRVAFGDVKAD